MQVQRFDFFVQNSFCIFYSRLLVQLVLKKNIIEAQLLWKLGVLIGGREFKIITIEVKRLFNWAVG